MKKQLRMLAGILCIGVLFSGCGKEKAEEKKEVEEEPKVTYQVIGRESKDAYEMLVTNNTEKVITGIQIKSSEQTEYPANIMSSEQKIEKDETVKFYYTSEESLEGKTAEGNIENEGAQISENGEGTPGIADAVINVTYSLQITFEDGTAHELSSFAVDDIEEVTICCEDEVAFLTYMSKSEKVEINTKEAELAVKMDKEAARVVAEQIQNVGEVTMDSEAAIQAARAAYDALTDLQRQMVPNGQLLVDQEGVLAALKQQAAEQAAAEQAAAERVAAEQAAAERAAQRNNNSNNGSSNNNGGDSSSNNSGGASQGTDSCLNDVILN
jgi:hypothetical protein